MSTSKTRNMVVVAMMSAIAVVIYFIEFSLPIMPGFIKLDFSNVMSLIASFALGPVEGVLVSLIKNIIHVLIRGFGSTMGIGDFFDFVTSAAFAFTAGFVYKKKRTFNGAMLGCALGTLVFSVISLPLNYFVTYPVYAKAFGGMDAIIGAYKALLPNVDNLFAALCIFNFPFTLVKGILCTAVTILIYKPLSPIIKGSSR